MSEELRHAADEELDLEEIRRLAVPQSPSRLGDAVLSLAELEQFVAVAVSFYGRWKDRQQLTRISRFMQLVSRRLDQQAFVSRDHQERFARDVEVVLERVQLRVEWDKRAYYAAMLINLWTDEPPAPHAERDRMIARLSSLSLSNLRMLAAVVQMNALPQQLRGQSNVNLPIVLQAIMGGAGDDLNKMDWDELARAGIVNNWNTAMVQAVAFRNFDSFITPFGMRFVRYLAGADEVEAG